MNNQPKKSWIYRFRIFGYLVLALSFMIGWWIFSTLRGNIFEQFSSDESTIGGAFIQQLHQNATSFFSFIGIIILLGFVWFLLVRKENKKVLQQQFGEGLNQSL